MECKDMKYKIGDYVSKPIASVCRVADILHLDMVGVKPDTLFYLLIPVENRQEKIYVPVESAQSSLRLCLTSEEAWKLIERIPEIQVIWIDNEKMRIEQGKKSTSSDERYFQMAENLLYTELGLALKKPKQESSQLIIDFIDKNDR